MSFDHILREIGNERMQQKHKHGFDTAHDDAHDNFELPRAASVYALYASLPALDRDFAAKYGPGLYGSQEVWPWDRADLKLTTRRHELIKAAALIVAEIERLDRAQVKGAAK